MVRKKQFSCSEKREMWWFGWFRSVNETEPAMRFCRMPNPPEARHKNYDRGGRVGGGMGGGAAVMVPSPPCTSRSNCFRGASHTSTPNPIAAPSSRAGGMARVVLRSRSEKEGREQAEQHLKMMWRIRIGRLNHYRVTVTMRRHLRLSSTAASGASRDVRAGAPANDTDV